MEEKTVQSDPAKKTQSSNLGVPAKTILLIVVLALVAGGLTYVALSPKKSSPQPQAQTTIVSPADTTLSIQPSLKDPASKSYSSVVYVDSGKNVVNGIQLELYYDPKIITNVSITALNFFPSSTEILKKIDQANGRISYAIASSIGENGVKGKGNLAKITYTPVLGSGIDTSSFNFLPKTEVSGLGTDASLLKETKDGQINIATPTPTGNSATGY